MISSSATLRRLFDGPLSALSRTRADRAPLAKAAARHVPDKNLGTEPLSTAHAAGSQPRQVQAVLLSRANTQPHAGGKAPADVEAICARMGLQCISLPPVPEARFARANIDRFLFGTARLIVRVAFGGIPAVVIIQHPIVGRFEKKLILFLFRRSKKIALIHDLDVLRKPTDHTYDDLGFLAQCDVLIVHNEAMRRFLAKELPRSNHIVLGTFDYLVSAAAPGVKVAASEPTRLYIIGNLHPMKASYLYLIGELSVPLSVYGPNCDVARLPAHVAWMGVVGDQGLPVDSVDGFGLVWDGESPDALTGVWGEYLRFNAPHKLSMYVVLGLPVIVHRDSAMADFVRREGIGMTATSIEDASRLVRECSAESWSDYCKAVLGLRQKLVSGFHTRHAVEFAMKVVKSDG